MPLLSLQQWLLPPRLVLTLFFLLMASCAVALTWLGWQLLEQDRGAEKQRHRERLETAAASIAANLQLVLSHGDIQIRVTPSATTLNPPGGLPFVPIDDTATPDLSQFFATAEALEFSNPPSPNAPQAYLDLARYADSSLRAEALVRAARVQRRIHLPLQALQTYQQLEILGQAPVHGMPAAVIARSARCSLFAERGNRNAAAKEAQLLWSELTNGRWLMNRQTFETYTAQLNEWLPNPPVPEGWSARLRLADIADQAWHDRHSRPAHRFLLLDGQPFSIHTETANGAWSANLTGPQSWLSVIAGAERRFGVRLRLTQPGEPVPSGNYFSLPSAITGLPINLSLSAAEAVELTTNRRRILLAGFLVFAILIAGCTIFIARSINRELAIVRLQSDFVAAVSHEFRTPLTSIRQLTELLAKGRIKDTAQIQKSYELMLSESDRLKRLIESILGFGRMSSGTYQFRFEPVPINEFTSRIIAAYRAAAGAQLTSLEFVIDQPEQTVRADREALHGALWNLLDNAVKYSPSGPRVIVTLTSANSLARIRVEDQGIGIPKSEHRRIFERFYRGEATRTANAKGTGIGLALVQEIMQGHGGAITVESEPGRGSAFTIVLPIERTYEPHPHR